MAGLAPYLLRGESLETRTLLSITWTGGGDGISWNDAANWGGTLPGANDNVVIPAGFTVVHSTGSDTIHSLQSASALTLSGGALTVGTTASPGTVEVDNNFTLSGGTLADADIKPGSGGQGLTLTNSGGTLDHVTADANLDLTQGFNVSAFVSDGLTLNGAATLGDANGHYGALNFLGSQTLGGTGSVLFSTSAANSVFMDSAAATLTIGPSVTVHGQSGSIDGVSNATLANQGKIDADTAGGTIQVQPSGGIFTNSGTVEADTGGTLRLNGAWSNTGTLNLNGGTLDLGGGFTTAGIGTFSRTGGTLNLVGTLDNTGATLALDAATGPWQLLGGTIKNGTYTSTGANELVVTNFGGTLDGLTANGDLDMTEAFNAYAFIQNGLTLNGAATLGSAAGHYATMYFLGSQTLGGSGSVTLANASSSVYMNAAGTLTIGPQMTIHGQSGSVDGLSTSTIVNRGKIAADNSGGTLQLAPGGGALTNQGTLEVDAGATLQLNGTWSNTGTMNLNGGTLILGGNFTTAGIGNLARTGGTLKITGTLDNTAATLALNAATGPWLLAGGTVKNGTYTNVGANQLVLTNFGGTLDGLTANGDLDMTEDFNVVVFIKDGLTLNGAATLGSAAGHYATMYFLSSETLGGSGSVTLANASSSVYMDAAAALTLGPALTIHWQSGNIDGFSTSTIINQGKIAADTAGGTISIQPGGGTFTNQGSVETDTGTTVQINGTWSNAGTLVVNRGTLDLGGKFTTSGIGTMLRNGGTVNITGTLDNTGSLLSLNDHTGSWQLMGGTIKGGTYTSSLGASLVLTNTGGTLDGLTANGDLDLTEGFNILGTIVDGLTLNGVATLGSASGHYATLYFSGSQVLGGTGSMALANLSDSIYVLNAATTLTVGPTISIHGRGSIDGQATSTVINQGKITAEGSGTLLIQPSGGGFVNQGTVRALRGGTLTADSPQLAIDGSSSLVSMPSGTVAVRGNLTGATTNATLFTPYGALLFNGSGTAAAPQTLEAMSDDLGAVASAFNGNFALGKLTLQGSTYLKLVDQSDNAPGAGAEAVYVNSLTVPAGTTLDLNGLHLYARSATINGTALDGTVTMAPASSTITWTGADAATSTKWSDPNNWSTGTVPVAGDTVIFDGTAQNSLATVDAGFSPGGPLADIQISWSGEITINPGVNLAAFNVEFGGGTLDGAGTLTVADSLTWSAGTMSGGGTTVVAETASLLINDASNLTIGNHTLNNFGAAVFTGAGWDWNTDGVFNNEPGATFDMQSDAGYNLFGASAFNNAGTFTRSVGTGAVHIGPAFNNSGTVDVKSGMLSLDGGGTSTGVFASESGASLNFGGATDDLSAPSTQVFGAGTVGFTGATVTIGGGYAVTGTTSITSGEVDFNHDATSTATVLSGGNLGGTATFTTNGSFEWSGGSMLGGGTTVISPATALTIDDPTDITLGNRALNNYGAATFTGVRWDWNTGSVFNNESGATFDMQSDANYNVFGASTFNNAGTFTKSIGTAATHVNPAFNNSGSVDVKSGTLSLDGGGTSSGSFTVETGAALDFGGGTHDLSASTTSITGAGTVGFTGATTIIGGIYTVTGTTSISGGEVDFNHDATSTTTVLSGGNLGGTATFTTNGSFEWSGGAMLGGGTTVIPATATLTIDDPSNISLGNRALNNFGSATFTGVRWDWNTGGVFNNESGATFDMQSDASYNVFGTSAFNNAGTFTKSIGTSTTHIAPSFNNSGTVDVKSGTLSLDGGGTSSGAFTAENGAELDFGGGTHDLSSANSSISGGGTIGFTGATVIVGGSYMVTGTTSISGGEADFNHDATSTKTTLSGGNLGGTATFTTNGSFEWAGGNMLGGGTTVIPAAAALTIDDPSDITLGNRALNNFGSATFTGARWDWNTGSVFNNESGATFDMQSDANYSVFGSSTFNNAGTFTKSIGTATTHVSPAINNSGSVDVKSGILSLEGGGTSSGSFSAEMGAALDFGGGTHDLSASTTAITGAGTVGFTGATAIIGGTYSVTGTTSISGGEVDFNHDATSTKTTLSGGSLGGTATFTTNGSFEWSGGTMVGGGTTVIPAAATLTIDDPGDISLGNRALNNFGSATFTGARWDWNAGGVFNNESGATFDMQSDASYNVFGTSAFNNAGTFTKSIGTATTGIGPAFSNTGTVDVKTGTLSLEGGFTQTAGETILDGGALQNTSALSIAGGKLSGRGTVTGDVDNSGGTLSPGFSPGTINITGNYTQGPGGTLAVEIGGLTPGTGFDVLNISGTANLDGTLAISLINNFLPAVGDAFQIITYAAKNGQFSQYTGLDSGNNRLLSPNYFPTNLTLVAGTELTATGTPIAAVVGQAFTGMVATVTDADTNDTAANLTATIDWGDGSSSTGTVSSNGQGGFDVSGSHTYTSVASGLPVNVTISDQGGSTVVAETTADVGQTLIAAGRTFAATEGLNFSGTVATAVDPTAEAGGLTATIDWGDGTTDAGTVSPSGNGFSITGSHTYAEEGTKSVTVVVQDPQQTTSTAHSTANISDASLTATATTVAATEGATFSGTVATFTDADPGALPGDFTAEIAWGDGATTSGSITTGAGGGFVVNGSHIYADEATRTVTVTVSDQGGATATATTAATVSDATLAATGTAITTTEGATFSGTVATY
ncbi:MAG TPA: hypothetical protein VJ783_31135, partial [Pirellulales bacterium]|nr:hypothetical protein [Pirellulales bacterium]